jgi:uncharacterized protein (TIGR03000 family)
MMALSGGADAADFGKRGGGCNGNGGGCNGYVSNGCHGGNGHVSNGCHGGNGCNGGGHFFGGGGGLFGGRRHGRHGGNGCNGGNGCHGGYSGCHGGSYSGCHGGGYSGCHGGHAVINGGGCHGGHGVVINGGGCHGGHGVVIDGGAGCTGGGVIVNPVPHHGPVGPGTPVGPGPGVEQPKVMPKVEPKTTNPNPKQVQNVAPATIIVSLPAEAKLTVDGNPTTSTSARRTLITPALETANSYVYTLRAELVRDGQTLSETQQITVRGGQTTEVPFNFTSQGVASR